VRTKRREFKAEKEVRDEGTGEMIKISMAKHVAMIAPKAIAASNANGI
jgi:phage anti-repressor protein